MACLNFSSDFYAALVGAFVGGGVSGLLQWGQFRREDRKADAAQQADDLATAQTILFKLQHVVNVFHNIHLDTTAARAAVGPSGDLWTRFQPPAHSPQRIEVDYREFHLLARKRQFDLLADYQQAFTWLNNISQSLDAYRTLYLQWSEVPIDSLDGQVGTVRLTETNRHILPLIANMRSLGNSLEDVVASQTTDLKTMLAGYPKIMFEMVGLRPKIAGLTPGSNESPEVHS